MNDRDIIVGVVALLLIVGGVLFAVSGGPKPAGGPTENSGPVDLTTREAKLAQCLKDRGAVFYGAFWCPHCQAQKRLFGSAEKLLPYVECSTPDGNNQNAVCKDKKIQSYPTWVFADGSQETGEVSLDSLEQKAGCGAGGTATTTTSAPTPAPVVNETAPATLPFSGGAQQ